MLVKAREQGAQVLSALRAFRSRLAPRACDPADDPFTLLSRARRAAATLTEAVHMAVASRPMASARSRNAYSASLAAELRRALEQALIVERETRMAMLAGEAGRPAPPSLRQVAACPRTEATS
jgi:hypothetical protein